MRRWVDAERLDVGIQERVEGERHQRVQRHSTRSSEGRFEVGVAGVLLHVGKEGREGRDTRSKLLDIHDTVQRKKI